MAMTQILRVVPISSIVEGKRYREEYKNLNDLAQSFKTEGIIQPLAVKDIGEGIYHLLAGGRRFKAAQLAALKEIPVRVYPPELTELQMREVELMENVCREDLTWYEAARLRSEIHKLKVEMHGEKTSTSPDAPGHSLRDTAALLDRSVGGLSQDIQLIKACDMFPQLKEAKTAHEATKMMTSLKENLVKAELSRRLTEKQANTPLEQIHASIMSRYVVEDFFTFVQRVQTGSIDIVEIDPPYGIDLHSTKKMENRDVKLDIYNEVKADEYPLFIDKVLKECYRVMKDNSHLILWFAIEPWIETMYQLLVKNGFKTRRLAAMWYKGDGQLQSMQPDRYLASSYEPFFYAAKGDATLVRQGRSNVFHYRPVPHTKKVHPTERPIELMEDILSVFCTEGAYGLVPFLGSGNTILAGANLNMTIFGTDLVPEYKDSFNLNVSKGKPQLYKSYKDGGV